LALVDGDHSATINLGKARFRTSLATTPWREVGLQEICRIRGSGHHRGGCAARSANPVTFDYEMVKPALNSVDLVILRSLVQQAKPLRAYGACSDHFSRITPRRRSLSGRTK
jgi:hypothetical protein